MLDLDTVWDYLIDHEIVSEETLNVITAINGYNEDTLNAVIYATTGYHDLEQLQEYE